MTFIIIWAAGLLIAALVVATKIAKCKKPVVMALRTSLSGLAALMIVNAFQALTGFAIAVNYVTVCCAVVLGAPGTVLLLVLRLVV